MVEPLPHDEVLDAFDAACRGDVARLVALAARTSPKLGRQLRDVRLTGLSAWLAAELPRPSVHRVALILTAAGYDLQRQRALTSRPPYHLLGAEDRRRLADEVADILAWAPCWPGERQMRAILWKSWQRSRVETANNSAPR